MAANWADVNGIRDESICLLQIILRVAKASWPSDRGGGPLSSQSLIVVSKMLTSETLL
jgi:hypothetical protein